MPKTSNHEITISQNLFIVGSINKDKTTFSFSRKMRKCTPFKITYCIRNRFLVYAVNCKQLAPDSQLWQTLDEMTSMKILSRIEGDSDRTQTVLEKLKALVDEHIVNVIPPAEEGKPAQKSISAAKIDEMLAKLKATSFISYWA